MINLKKTITSGWEKDTTDHFRVNLQSNQLECLSWLYRDKRPRIRWSFINSARLLQQWTVLIQARERLAGLLNANLNRTMVSDNLPLIDTITVCVNDMSSCTERMANTQNNTLVSSEITLWNIINQIKTIIQHNNQLIHITC